MNKQGISLTSLIITIVVIIIIATVAIFTGFSTPDKANLTRFTHEVDELTSEIGTIRVQNFEDYRDSDYGFEKVTVTNAPEDFISADEAGNTVKGYVIDVTQIKEPIRFGRGTHTSGTVVFGQDDVYLYDKNGTIFYAKGYPSDDYIYYNATVRESYQ